MGRYGEIREDMGRYGEIWGDMGRYGEIWGDKGKVWGGVERCGRYMYGRYEEVEILKGTQLTETCTLVLMIVFFSDNKLFFHVSILLSSKLCFCMNQWAHDIFSNG